MYAMAVAYQRCIWLTQASANGQRKAGRSWPVMSALKHAVMAENDIEKIPVMWRSPKYNGYGLQAGVIIVAYRHRSWRNIS